MGDLNCYFHKDRTAASKCDDCGKYICLECQYESIESNFGNSSSAPTKICPYCKADKVENNDQMVIGVLACIGFVMVIIIFIGVASNMGGDPFETSPDTGIGIAIFFVILVIAIIIGTIIYASSNKEKKVNPEAEAIRAKAKKAIEESKNVVSAEEKHTPLFCQFCVAPIESDAKTCSYCGMNWVWKE